MGTTKIETYNFTLMQIADYSNIKQIKNLLRNYSNIFELAQCGDGVALSIYVDLKESLDPKHQVLTEIQLRCINLYYLDRWTLQEIGEHYERDESTISENINGGIKRIQKALLNGILYGRD